MPDPDLEIRGGGPGHPDHEISLGEAVSKNIFFGPSGPSLVLKKGGGGQLPGPLP